MTTASQRVQEAFAGANLPELSVGTYRQLAAYLDLLLRWNKRLSLTSDRAPEQILQRHFIECVFAAQHLPAEIETLMDYGSGAGFPGLIFGLCRPNIRVTLTEAHGRKAAFLREAVRVLGIHTEVFDGRVESLPENRLFDAVALRAVEKMEVAIDAAFPRARKYLILFTTAAMAPGHRRVAEDIAWFPGIHLPNSTQRILLIGKSR